MSSFDKLDALKTLISAHQNRLQILLSQRSAYGGHDVPSELNEQIDTEQISISQLQSEIKNMFNKELAEIGNDMSISDRGKEIPKSEFPFDKFDSIAQNSILARVPQFEDLLPILVPHNLVTELSEYKQVQEIAFTFSGIMFGGVLGILVNWLTAERWGDGQTLAAWIALVSFFVGTCLTTTAGFFWGIKRAKEVQSEIDHYIKTMQIIKMPISLSPKLEKTNVREAK